MTELLQYFEAELDLARRALRDFAAAHPDRARALGVAAGGGGGGDPDLARLLDSTALVAARLQMRLDQARGDLALDVLRQVAPSLLLGAPGFACLVPSGDTALPADPVRIPAGTRVLFGEEDETACVYTVAADTVLAPLRIAGLRVDSAPLPFPVPPQLTGVEGALVLELAPTGAGRTPDQVAPEALDLYLPGAAVRRKRLAEALASDLRGIGLATGPRDAGAVLPSAAMQGAVLSDAGGFLPRFFSQPTGPEVLHDFLAYPDKGFFFRLTGFGAALRRIGGAHAVLRLYLGRRGMGLLRRVDPGDIAVNAIPCLNLFETLSEPVQYSFARDRVPVRVPRGHGRAVRVLRVQAVTRLTPEGEVPLAEIGTVPVAAAAHSGPVWQERRDGDDPDPARCALSLSVPSDPATLGAGLDLVARLLCSNGDAGLQIRAGMAARIDLSDLALCRFRPVGEPAATVPPRRDPARYWDLVALLGRNLAALTDRPDPAAALRAALHLCAPDGFAADAAAIVSVQVRRGVAPVRIGRDHLLSAGVQVEVVIDPEALSLPPTVFARGIEAFLSCLLSYDRFLHLQVREAGTPHPFFAPPRRHGCQVSA